MKNLLVITMALALAVAGCSSSPKKEAAKDAAEAAKIQAQAAAEQRSRTQSAMEAEVSQVPDWALKPPAPDAEGVYAVGLGESQTLRIAMRKAQLDAEYGLAKNFNQELSGSERSYTQDNGSANITQYTELVDKLVSRVPVVGFEVVKQVTKPVDGSYRAFILLKLPYGQFNKVLREQKAETVNKQIKQAFDDLQTRLDRRREQRIEEDKLKQAAPSPAPATTAAPTESTPAPAAKQPSKAEESSPAQASSAKTSMNDQPKTILDEAI